MKIFQCQIFPDLQYYVMLMFRSLPPSLPSSLPPSLPPSLYVGTCSKHPVVRPLGSALQKNRYSEGRPGSFTQWNTNYWTNGNSHFYMDVVSLYVVFVFIVLLYAASSTANAGPLTKELKHFILYRPPLIILNFWAEQFEWPSLCMFGS